MAWIESHADLRDHPKTDLLMDLLGVTRRDAVGLIHFIWWRALTYAPSGDLAGFTDGQIARWADWDGSPADLMAGLTTAGFLDPERRLHDWQEYAGRWIDRREANAARKRQARSASKSGTSSARPPDVTQKSGATGPNRTGPNRTGPDPLSSVVSPLAASGATAPAKPTPERKTPKQSAVTTEPPESLEPTETEYRLGETVGLSRGQVDLAAAAMLDHWRAKGERRVDWLASLRTWLRNAAKYDQQRAPPLHRNGSANTIPPGAASKQTGKWSDFKGRHGYRSSADGSAAHDS